MRRHDSPAGKIAPPSVPLSRSPRFVHPPGFADPFGIKPATQPHLHGYRVVSSIMQTFTRRQLLGMMGAAGIARAAGSRPPNILYIMADDHAAHAISAYGSRINQTPNIDRL